MVKQNQWMMFQWDVLTSDENFPSEKKPPNTGSYMEYWSWRVMKWGHRAHRCKDTHTHNDVLSAWPLSAFLSVSGHLLSSTCVLLIEVISFQHAVLILSYIAGLRLLREQIVALPVEEMGISSSRTCIVVIYIVIVAWLWFWLFETRATTATRCCYTYGVLAELFQRSTVIESICCSQELSRKQLAL